MHMLRYPDVRIYAPCLNVTFNYSCLRGILKALQGDASKRFF